MRAEASTIRRFLALWLVALVLAACAAGTAAPAGPVDVRAGTSGTQQPPAAAEVPLPNRGDSLKFLAFGDFGTGDRPQYQLAEQMARLRATFPFELAVLLGDNMYGSQKKNDYERKFSIPYKPLLDAGVKFYASLGNHDQLDQRFFAPFNMDGKRYYSFKGPKQKVRFFALESSYLNGEQLRWLESELRQSDDDWKIAFFHHPPYSSGDRHGSDEAIREALEPLFLKYNVSVVLTGHDHFYERVKPQKGIAYFVIGSGGKLREGNITRNSQLTARGFDTDLAFMAAEIDGDEMFFNVISRPGRVVDSGVVTRRKPQ
jgi:predicted MPP superfamily phosphohydrolase